MDLDKILSIQEKCTNDNPPACVTECPIHVDAKGFIAEVRKGNFEEAYKVLRRRMPLPKVIGLLCDHPCEEHCETFEDGKAISIHELERAIVTYGRGAMIKTLAVPKNDKHIAIVGGGISGITCAWDLNQKGYNVVIYEKDDRLGGSLLKYNDVKQEDIDEIENMDIEVKLDSTIDSRELEHLTDEYDAVYIGTGKWGENYDVDAATLKTNVEKVFIGGRIVTKTDSLIQSVFSGRKAAVSIDRYAQKKSLTVMRKTEGQYESSLEVMVNSSKVKPRVKPSGAVFTKEEAQEEAMRCLQCECHRCMNACIHLRKSKLDSKGYIRMINQNERIILGDHYGNKTINTCTECGLCGAVCPNYINMADIIKDTRESMVERGKMPASAFDFAIKDMEFSSSKYFELVKQQPGTKSSKYVFYPGCQLSASYSEYIIKTYKYLMDKLDGGVAIYLGCCGAPADWAGRRDMFKAAQEKFKENLKQLGNPVVITACSTCFTNFKRNQKDIKIKMLWEVFKEKGIPEGASKGNGKILTIHDACTTRKEKNIHEDIRDIARSLGYKIHEPEFTRDTTKCCGYGGDLYFSDMAYSREVTGDRIKDDDGNDFLAYCAMCRDLFVLKGKKTYHILDLIFGNGNIEISDMTVPTLSQRRKNRLNLKKKILDEIWGEKIDLQDEYEDIKIIVDSDVRKKMEEHYILDGDIKKVIGYAESSKKSFYNPSNGHILASRRLVNVTFWVEYVKENDAYRIINAYSHRMDVTGVSK